MLLSDLDTNIKAIITSINCNNEELKQRFYSFGIIKGVEIVVEKISPTKDTIALIVDDTSIAIRLDEAKNIEVKVL
jgi:ferrous iron transport protein A